MCGLLGVIGKNRPEYRDFEGALALQHHRGPYSRKVKELKDATFGFARLPIIDADPRSDQPFEYGPITLIFNGEIYNYVELRAQLVKDGAELHCEGDTEVFAAALEHWGVDATMRRMKGMWAAMAHDARSNEFYIMRDRFGMKPLFYAHDKGALYVSSEIKSLQHLSTKCFEIDETVFDAYIGQGILDTSDETFFTHVKRFPSASYAIVSADGTMRPPVRYWKLEARNAQAYDPAKLQKLLENSVKMHLRSDFPVALALSGGIDSTVIAAYARHQSSDFTCYSSAHPVADAEKDLIEATRDALRLNHEFVPIEDVENVETVDFLLEHLDQPFIASTTLYQFNIRKAIAKRGYRVLMTGDGADEIFSSYTKSLPMYFTDLIRRGRLIYALQQAWALRAFAGLSFTGLLKHAGMSFVRNLSTPIHKDGALKGYIQKRCFSSPLPYWLRVEDGIAMSQSLETRLPFLDHEIAEYVYSLPPADFFKHGLNKFFLRDAAKDVLPLHISNQKKKFQRPGDNERLVFKALRSEMTKMLSANDLKAFEADVQANKNGRIWLRKYLGLRWRALIEARKDKFKAGIIPQRIAS